MNEIRQQMLDAFWRGDMKEYERLRQQLGTPLATKPKVSKKPLALYKSEGEEDTYLASNSSLPEVVVSRSNSPIGKIIGNVNDEIDEYKNIWNDQNKNIVRKIWELQLRPLLHTVPRLGNSILGNTIGYVMRDIPGIKYASVLSPDRLMGTVSSGFKYSPWDPENKGWGLLTGYFDFLQLYGIDNHANDDALLFYGDFIFGAKGTNLAAKGITKGATMAAKGIAKAAKYPKFVVNNYKYAHLPHLNLDAIYDYLYKNASIPDRGTYWSFTPVKKTVTETPNGIITEHVLHSMAMKPGNGTLETHMNPDTYTIAQRMPDGNVRILSKLTKPSHLVKRDVFKLFRSVPDHILLTSEANAMTPFLILDGAPTLNKWGYYLTGKIPQTNLNLSNFGQLLDNVVLKMKGGVKKPTFTASDFDRDVFSSNKPVRLRRKKVDLTSGMSKLYTNGTRGFSTDIMENMSLNKAGWEVVPSYNVMMDETNIFGTSYPKYAKYFGTPNDAGHVKFKDMTLDQVRGWNEEVVPTLGGNFHIDEITRTTPLPMRYKVGTK